MGIWRTKKGGREGVQRNLHAGRHGSRERKYLWNLLAGSSFERGGDGKKVVQEVESYRKRRRGGEE